MNAIGAHPLFRLGAALLVLLGAGCASSPGSAAATATARNRMPAWVSLERTFGGRSIYVITLREDGHAMFEAQTPQNTRRTLTKVLPASVVAPVFSQVELLNFWDRPGGYDVERTQVGGDSRITATAAPDAPWDILRAQRGSRIKRIDGLFFAPRDMIEFKALIERTVDLPGWTAELNAPPAKR